MPKVRMEDLADGGFINDASGKATERVRQQMRSPKIAPIPNYVPGTRRIRPIPNATGKPKIRLLGNPTLKRFGK